MWRIWNDTWERDAGCGQEKEEFSFHSLPRQLLFQIDLPGPQTDSHNCFTVFGRISDSFLVDFWILLLFRKRDIIITFCHRFRSIWHLRN